MLLNSGLSGDGAVAEWFKATVLKTVVPKGTGGSNPSCSVRRDENTRDAPAALRGFDTKRSGEPDVVSDTCGVVSARLEPDVVSESLLLRSFRVRIA